MIQELLYTSHEGRGLRQGGGGGFCTVLSTEGMASNLAAALEKLSGYKHPFDIHDPRSLRNPPNYRHAIIRIGGMQYHVLSRIADLRGEHTGRSNKLAHHVVLASTDCALGGPTRLLKHRGFCREHWDGKVTLVSQIDPRTLPTDDLPTRFCRLWHQTAGDAGWAGYVADKLLANSNPTVSVIFPLGVDALGLTDEVFSLIPADRRWSFTFSTYYAIAPPITSCHLRFVLDETSDAEQLRRDYRQVVIDLCNIPAELPDSELVSAARLGNRPKNQTVQMPITPSPFETVVAKSTSPTVPVTATSTEARESTFDTADYDVLPPIVREKSISGTRKLHTTPISTFHQGRTTKKRSARKWIAVTCIALISIGLLATGTYLLALNGKQLIARMETTEPNTNSQAVSVAEPPTSEPKTNIKSQSKSVAPTVLSDRKDPSHETDSSDPAREQSENSDPPSSNLTVVPAKDNDAEINSRSELGDGDMPSNNRTAGTALPSILIPTQVLAIQTFSVTSPPERTVLNSVALELAFRSGDHKNIELIGFDWVAELWKGFDNSNELEARSNPDFGTLQIVRKRVGLNPELLLCEWRVKDNALEFRWTEEALKQVETTRTKAGLLNGFKWCVLKFSTESGPEYVRMSYPTGSELDFALYPYSKTTTPIDSSLPSTIRTKLQIPDNAPFPILTINIFDRGTHDLTIHHDDFGGLLQSSLRLIHNKSFQWGLSVKSVLTFTDNTHTELSDELGSESYVRDARQKLQAAIDSLKSNENQIRQGIEKLTEKSTANSAQSKKTASKKLTKLQQDADILAQHQASYEQLGALLAFFQGRSSSLACQIEYEDGNRVIIVPILGGQETADANSSAPERFQ